MFLDLGDVYYTKRKLTTQLQMWGIISKRLRNNNGDRKYYYMNVEFKDGVEVNSDEDPPQQQKIDIDRLFGGT